MALYILVVDERSALMPVVMYSKKTICQVSSEVLIHCCLHYPKASHIHHFLLLAGLRLWMVDSISHGEFIPWSMCKVNRLPRNVNRPRDFVSLATEHFVKDLLCKRLHKFDVDGAVWIHAVKAHWKSYFLKGRSRCCRSKALNLSQGAIELSHGNVFHVFWFLNIHATSVKFLVSSSYTGASNMEQKKI